MGPILQCIESEVAKGAIPLHQIKEAYLWFGEHYGLGLGEDGSEPAAVPVEEGDGLNFATGSDDFGEENITCFCLLMSLWWMMGALGRRRRRFAWLRLRFVSREATLLFALLTLSH